jgi:hypothetical protein
MVCSSSDYTLLTFVLLTQLLSRCDGSVQYDAHQTSRGAMVEGIAEGTIKGEDYAAGQFGHSVVYFQDRHM